MYIIEFVMLRNNRSLCWGIINQLKWIFWLIFSHAINGSLKELNCTSELLNAQCSNRKNRFWLGFAWKMVRIYFSFANNNDSEEIGWLGNACRISPESNSLYIKSFESYFMSCFYQNLLFLNWWTFDFKWIFGKFWKIR